MNIWWLRVAWATLPVTTGWAVSDALASWDSATRATAAVLLWLLWGVVLVAVLAPRPASLTALRTGAPLSFALALLAILTGHPSAPASLAALAATSVCVVLAATPTVGIVCAQGAAYGDEERFPLAVPPALFLGVLPIAVLGVGVGLAAGPLLLAAGRTGTGIAALVAGIPVSALLLRSLHQLSRRWLVLVPAGVVVHDPMTLTDPYLFMRERIMGLGPADRARRAPEDALDLRLGAARGSLALLLDREAEVYRRSRSRGVGVKTHLLLVAPVATRRVLERAASRRIPVRHTAKRPA